MLIPSQHEPAPDFDKFARAILAGAFLDITEVIIAAQPNASNKFLFSGGFTEADRGKAFCRIEVILRAFIAAFPSQREPAQMVISS